MSFTIEKSANCTDTSFSSLSSVPSLECRDSTSITRRSLSSESLKFIVHQTSTIENIPHNLIDWGRCKTKYIHIHPLSQINFSKLLTLLNSNCFTANFRKKSSSTAFCKDRKWCMLSGPTLISVIPIAFENNVRYKSSRGSMISGTLTWNKHKNYR